MKFPIGICLLPLLLSSNDSNGQLIKAYGAKIAFTSAHQNFDYTYLDVETKWRNGFNAAIFVEWLKLPFFSIVSQLEYAQRGMGMELVQTGPSSPQEIGRFTKYNRVDYVSIPLFAKLTIPATPVSPYLSIGPRFDLLLRYKSDDNLLNPVYDEFKKANVGGTISLGGESNDLFPIDLLLEIRYNIDFANAYSTQYLKVRNTSLDIWLGVTL